MKRIATVIKEMKAKFNTECKPSSEFYGEPSKGIWVTGIGTLDDDNSAFDYASTDYDFTEEVFTMGVHNTVNKYLEDAGYYAEPYDAGTWMLWPI